MCPKCRQHLLCETAAATQAVCCSSCRHMHAHTCPPVPQHTSPGSCTGADSEAKASGCSCTASRRVRPCTHTCTGQGELTPPYQHASQALLHPRAAVQPTTGLAGNWAGCSPQPSTGVSRSPPPPAGSPGCAPAGPGLAVPPGRLLPALLLLLPPLVQLLPHHRHSCCRRGRCQRRCMLHCCHLLPLLQPQHPVVPRRLRLPSQWRAGGPRNRWHQSAVRPDGAPVHPPAQGRRHVGGQRGREYVRVPSGMWTHASFCTSCWATSQAAPAAGQLQRPHLAAAALCEPRTRQHLALHP